jgi:hypothetical protein
LNIKREEKERIIELNINTELPHIEKLVVAINSLKKRTIKHLKLIKFRKSK